MTENSEKPTCTFSFVVPVYNEQDGLAEKFYPRLKAVADDLGEPHEIIFVNDGSSDRTPEILRELAAGDPSVRVVEFARNFGHQWAVTAGYDYAQGRAVISLDADCQHPPEMIPQLIQRWRDGYEVVYTVRKDNEGTSGLRTTGGRCVYRVMRWMSGVDLTDQADFRLLDRRVVDVVKQHREQARLLRGLVRHVGFRQTSVPYTAEKRAAGESVYTLRQLIGMAGAGVFNFSTRPLRLVAAAGGGLAAVGLAGMIAWGILAALGLGSAAWSLGMLMILLGGLQLIGMGLVGEYVGRIFEESKRRPLYIVREAYGFKPAQRQEDAPSEAEEEPEPEPAAAPAYHIYT
ncbi:MAG: glycosyltransferase family 2 protein [Phycisphaerae bacterium]